MKGVIQISLPNVAQSASVTIVGKLFETLINKILVSSIESHELMLDVQYGLKYTHSTGDLFPMWKSISLVM